MAEEGEDLGRRAAAEAEWIGGRRTGRTTGEDQRPLGGGAGEVVVRAWRAERFLFFEAAGRISDR